MDYNHKRILRIRLLLIESHLCDIISELESDTTNSTLILYSVRNNMSSEVRIQILSTVNSMLDEIRHMKENFALESEEKSIRKQYILHNHHFHHKKCWCRSNDDLHYSIN